MNLNKQLKNLYTRQYTVWETARNNIDALKNVEIKTFSFGNFEIKAQFNPARIVSSGAKLDEKTIQNRKCFLCKENRPEIQVGITYHEDYEILVNPYPILPYHFTIPRKEHVPQAIFPYYADMLSLAKDLDEFTILYNGPAAGASAPDHMHFQAIERNHLPFEYETNLSPSPSSMEKGVVKYPSVLGRAVPLSFGEGLEVRCNLRTCIVIESKDKKSSIDFFENIYSFLQKEKNKEPMMNVFCRYENGIWKTFIFPREKHRPWQYFAEGEDNMLISPGAIDIGGMLIMPLKKDFDKLNNEIIADVYRQVSRNIEQPTVSVGIMSEEKIEFILTGAFKTADGKSFSGKQQVVLQNEKIAFNNNIFDELYFYPIDENANFELRDVTIGINFHWERKENQSFSGALKFLVEDKKITAVNILPVEDYLKSVISSEMSASASLELLKAHAVISRSWLLAQTSPPASSPQERGMVKAPSVLGSVTPSPLERAEGEVVVWYERDAHQHFDVCADDHCQRYQGITRTNTQTAIQAVEETYGEVLMSESKICDARFSKSCGGMSEKFENCWADTPHDYLTNIVDNDKNPDGFNLDLTIEENAQKWIRQSPHAFCNTQDKKILSQVLNNYDQETTDFYRWKVIYSQEEISSLIKKRSGMDFGDIIDLIPVLRGASGRLVKLKIVGTKKTIIVGKELEIRKWLSESHLYSSAFVIDKETDENGKITFTLTGAGWGHGVGLCQIGAAVMGEKGYDYKEILAHYYKGSELRKLYF